MASEEAQRIEQEADARWALFIGQHFGISQAGMIIDREMEDLPTRAVLIALALAVAGDAMADSIDAAELFGIDIDHVTRSLALVADDRHGRLKAAAYGNQDVWQLGRYANRAGVRPVRPALVQAAQTLCGFADDAAGWSGQPDPSALKRRIHLWTVAVEVPVALAMALGLSPTCQRTTINSAGSIWHFYECLQEISLIVGCRTTPNYLSLPL